MNNIIKRVWNQNRLVNIEDLTGMAFQAESGGHTFEISGIDDTGAAVTLSGTVSGVFRRPDNADIALTGSASDGVVSVTLSEDCYAVPGRFGLTIFVTSNSQKVAVYACVGTVAVSSTGNVAGDTPASVEDLIDDINAAIADLNSAIGQIPASYANVMAAIAPTYSGSALYPVGAYAWYNGSLYRCTTAITTAESWTASHWTAVNLGADVSNLKSALALYPNKLPDGYTQLQWIQSDGTQWINTGINFASDFGFEIDFISYNDISYATGGYGCLLGSRVGSQDQEIDLNTFFVSGLTGGIFRYGTSLQTSGYIVPTKRQTISWKDGVLTVDGETKGTFATNVTNNGKPIYLFALNNNGSVIQKSKTRLFSCKFYNGDTIVRDFVPVSDSLDGTVGLYDLVDGVFYTDRGGTNFAYMPYYADTKYTDELFALNDLKASESLKYGYYLAGDGRSAVINTDNLITGFIPIKKGQTIVYEGIYVSASATAFAFYTDRNYATYVYGVRGLGYNVAPVEGEYTATQDGYCVIGCRKEYKDKAFLYFKDAFSDGENARFNYLVSLINSGVSVPNYWESEINSSEDSYIDNEKVMSANSVSFAFVTDVHWGSNAKNSPSIINRLMNDLDLDVVVCGGDIVTSNNNTKDGAIDLLMGFYDKFKTPIFATVGNHDNNSDHQADTSLILSDGTLYGRIIKPTEKLKDSNTFHNIGCSYFDNESQKVRFVQFDSGTPMYHNGTSVTVDTNALNANAEKAGELIAELASDWTAIIFTHQYWNPVAVGDTPTPNTYVYDAIKTYILDVAHTATIACIVSGHIHRDMTGTITNSANTETVRVIGTTTDNCSASQNQYGGPSMTSGTNTEQAIDLFQIDVENKAIEVTRVGAGSDRSFTF